MKSYFRLAALLVVAAVLVSISISGVAFGQSASASGSFSLQGKLTASNGTPVSDGMHTVVVKVYQRGTATAIYSETDTATTTGGIFSVLVGSGHATKLTLDATSNYEVGIALDGGAEMAPHITLASAPRAITSNVSDSSLVAGVALTIAPGATGVVTSVNGLQGAVTLQGGGNLAFTNSGNTIGLTFTGLAGGLLLPFTQALPDIGGLFNLTNTSTGPAATFTNSGTGGAMIVRDSLGSAISANSKGQAPTFDVSNYGGVAINALSTVNSAITATTNASISPALIVKNTGAIGTSSLFQAQNAASIPVLDLSTTSMKLATAAAAPTDAVLRLQNTVALGGSLIAAVDNTGSPLFTLGSTGSATFKNTQIIANDTGGTAINALSYVANGAILRLQNGSNAAGAGLISAANGVGNTVFTVAGSGATAISASAAAGAALTVSNLSGAAISATGNISNGAVLSVQNGSSAATANLLAARDSVGGAVLTVGVNGATTLRSTAHTALDVATTDTTGAGAKIAGGLTLIGPAGTGTIPTAGTNVTVYNRYATANSIILITINGSGSAQGIRLASQTAGSFVVSLVGGSALSSPLGFNYLIINAQ